MLKTTIDTDLKAAMLSGDKQLVEALRGIKSALLYKEVAEGKRDTGLSEQESHAVLKKEAKSRKDAMALYEQAGETARYELEAFQLKVIESYLPEEMSEQEIRACIDAAVTDLGGVDQLSIKDMGKVISAVKAKAPSADGSAVAQLVKTVLLG